MVIIVNFTVHINKQIPRYPKPAHLWTACR
jgi:hypothetical protein